MGSQAPTHSSYWEKLPTEVRDLIFDRLSDGYPNKNDYFGVCCICDNYTVIPPLLIALRGLPHSYRDALKRFNAINQVLDTCFDPHVNEICRLTETELKAFKEMRMRLLLANFPDDRPCRASNAKLYLTVPRALKHMALGTNLRTLKLDMFDQRTSYWYEKGNFEHALAGKAFVTEFPFFLAPFKSLEYVSLELPIWCANIPRRHRIVHGMIR